MTGQFLQAPGDQRGGLGDVTAAFRDPRAQEGELWPGKRRADGEPVQQLILGGSREPAEEHLVPGCPFPAPGRNPAGMTTHRRREAATAAVCCAGPGVDSQMTTAELNAAEAMRRTVIYVLCTVTDAEPHEVRHPDPARWEARRATLSVT